MMTAIKQRINAVLMYIYLVYYVERIRRDTKFMHEEVVFQLKSQDT